MTMQLYSHPFSLYSQKAKMAFYENATPFEEKLLDGSDPVASDFAARWPLRKFPILVEDDRLVTEATIIVEYLDVHHPGAVRFVPDDRDAALEVRMMDRFFDNYVSGALQRVVDEARRTDGLKDAAADAQGRALLETAYGVLDRWMATRTWAAAGCFSLADCAAAPALLYADWTHPIPKAHAHVWAYRDRLLARPSYARALDEARPYRHYFPLGAPVGRD